MHRKSSILDYFRQWAHTTRKPLCISEFGTPETYNPATRVDDYNRYIRAGIDEHRVMQCRELRTALEATVAEGISVPFGGWYPGTGNIGWGQSLTRERKAFDCDRAGLVDLKRTADGTLERVACPNLIREVLALRDIGEKAAAATPAWMAAAATAGAASPLYSASGD
jgi:hypothetical protein